MSLRNSIFPLPSSGASIFIFRISGWPVGLLGIISHFSREQERKRWWMFSCKICFFLWKEMQVLLLASYWPELGHVTIQGYKEAWNFKDFTFPDITEEENKRGRIKTIFREQVHSLTHASLSAPIILSYTSTLCHAPSTAKSCVTSSLSLCLAQCLATWSPRIPYFKVITLLIIPPLAFSSLFPAYYFFNS